MAASIAGKVDTQKILEKQTLKPWLFINAGDRKHGRTTLIQSICVFIEEIFCLCLTRQCSVVETVKTGECMPGICMDIEAKVVHAKCENTLTDLFRSNRQATSRVLDLSTRI